MSYIELDHTLYSNNYGILDSYSNTYRARRAAQTEEQMQACVQRRHHRVAAESTEQRAA